MERPASPTELRILLWQQPASVQRRRIRCAGQVTGLTESRPAASGVDVAARSGLRGYAYVHDVSFHQDGGVHNVEIGAQDGEVGAVRRGHVDLAIKRVLGGGDGAGM